MPPIDEQDLPAVRGHQSGGDDAGNGAAEWHKADADQRERCAVFARRGFGIDCDHVRDDAADAEAGKQAQPEKLLKVGLRRRRPG